MTRAFVTFRSKVILLAALVVVASLIFTGRAWSQGQDGFISTVSATASVGSSRVA
jgi:hypothetical protein